MPAARLSPALADRIRAALDAGVLRGTVRPPQRHGERSASTEPRKRSRGLGLANSGGNRAPSGGRPARRGGKSALVERLVAEIEAAGLPAPVWAGSPGGEFLPIPGRRFRLDLAWPDLRLGWEVDGGAWIAGRHGRGPGMLTDAEKYSLLAGLGWLVGRSIGVKAKGRGQIPLPQPGSVGWIRAALERARLERSPASPEPTPGGSSQSEP